MERKPKFRVGQVVCIIPSSLSRIVRFRRAVSADTSKDEWQYSFDYYERHAIWFPESRLRPLTKREKGTR